MPIRSGADRKKWSSRVLTTPRCCWAAWRADCLARVKPGRHLERQDGLRGAEDCARCGAAPGGGDAAGWGERRWRGGWSNSKCAGRPASPVAPKPRPRPHRQDKHWATTERSERKFRPTVVSQADQLRAPRTAVTNSLEQTFCALTSLTRWVSLLFDCAPGWLGAQVKIGSGRERMMTRGEWIIQLTKIALGVAIAAYFMWWSLEVLQRLPPR